MGNEAAKLVWQNIVKDLKSQTKEFGFRFHVRGLREKLE